MKPMPPALARVLTRRALHRYDRSLYRLPAPFYRRPDLKVVAGPSARRVVLVTDAGVRRGWIVDRTHEWVGYWVEDGVGPDELPHFEMLKSRPVEYDDEGITWAFGWDDVVLDAIKVAVALS